MTALPVELWTNILSCLDEESFLSHRFRTLYLRDVLSAQGHLIEPELSLKHASLVCWTWRKLVWPLLFKHLYFRIHNRDLQLNALRPRAGAFINQHFDHLSRVTQTITLFIAPSVEPIHSTYHYDLLEHVTALTPRMIKVVGNSLSLSLFTPGYPPGFMSEELSMLSITPEWAPELKDNAARDWWDSDILIERLLSSVAAQITV